MITRQEIFGNSLVSIIIVFLNAEKFIKETIESVFAQTYGNWELLMVDDGSTDQSREIALNYSSHFPNITYLDHDNHQNKGISSSRNLGLQHAKGEYIALLDSDDVWFPQKIAEQLEIMANYPDISMLYGRSEYWFSWTEEEEIKRDFIPDLGVMGDKIINPPALLKRFLKKSALPPPPSAIMARTKFITKVGGWEDEFTGLYEDLVLFSKLMLKAPVYVSNKCWEKYRQHPESCCVVDIGKFDSTHLRYLKWFEKYLGEQGAKGTCIWKLTQKKLWSYRHPTMNRFLSMISHHLKRTWNFFTTITRVLQSKSSGWIISKPNPIYITDRSGLGDTKLHWKAIKTSCVEIHVNSPDGPLFSKSISDGSASTGKWVCDGTTFYLQDASTNNPLSKENTLSSVTIRIIDNSK